MATAGGTPRNQFGESGYTFTDVVELDDVIQGWLDQRDQILSDGSDLERELDIPSPADDPVTADYFTALSAAYQGLAAHNREMSAYTADYVTMLTACRTVIAEIEDVNASRFRREGRA